MIKDLLIDEDGQAALEVVEAFTKEKILPAAVTSDRDSGYLIGLLGELDKLGVFGPSDEAPDGAVQLSLLETVASGDPGLAYHLAGEVAARRIVEASGMDAPLGMRLDLAYYEGLGRSPLEIQTDAKPTDTGYLLTGQKRNVVMPSQAGSLVAVAQFDGAPAAFLLDGKALTDMVVVRDDQVVGKLGLRSAGTADIRFDNLAVDESARLAADETSVLRASAWYRLAVSSIAVGIGQASVRYATDYAMQRVAFGQEIINYQGVEFPLVEADMALDAARLQILETWDFIRCVPGTEQNVRRVSHTYGVACSAALNASVVGVNSLGGHGYLVDHPVERWYRDSTTIAALDFDPLVHSSSIF